MIGNWRLKSKKLTTIMGVAGIKSESSSFAPPFANTNDRLSETVSCDLALVRLGRRVPPYHPFVRAMAELAPAPRRFVPHVHNHIYVSDLVCVLALTFVLAPLPNALFAHCGGDDFSTAVDEGSGPVDLGRFITSIVVVTGFALPLVLAHSDVIHAGACAMSILGGGCVYNSCVFVDSGTNAQRV